MTAEEKALAEAWEKAQAAQGEPLPLHAAAFAFERVARLARAAAAAPGVAPDAAARYASADARARGAADAALGALASARSHYATLGLASPGAAAAPDDAAVRRAYLKLAQKYHPDKNGGDGHKLFQAVAAAYEALGDARAKAAHDAELAARWREQAEHAAWAARQQQQQQQFQQQQQQQQLSLIHI